MSGNFREKLERSLELIFHAYGSKFRGDSITDMR